MRSPQQTFEDIKKIAEQGIKMSTPPLDTKQRELCDYVVGDIMRIAGQYLAAFDPPFDPTFPAGSTVEREA